MGKKSGLAVGSEEDLGGGRRSWSTTEEGEYTWDPLAAEARQGGGDGGGAGGTHRGRPILAFLAVIILIGVLFILVVVSAIRFRNTEDRRVDCRETWGDKEAPLKWTQCDGECDVEGGPFGVPKGGRSVHPSKVDNQHKGAGIKCRKELNVQCARRREIMLKVKVKISDQTGSTTAFENVCPRSHFPRTCINKHTHPDWGKVKKGQFYILRHDQYYDELEGFEDKIFQGRCLS